MKEVIKQGQIIEINFNPQKGHEQRGHRPAIVVSNESFNKRTSVIWCCPITHTDRPYPLHIELPEGLKKTGFVLCDHLRSMDIEARGYRKVEMVPEYFLGKVLHILKLPLDRSV